MPSIHRERLRTLGWTVPIPLAFVSLGLLSGWLVSVSAAPVVAAFLPLIPAVVAGIGQLILGRAFLATHTDNGEHEPGTTARTGPPHPAVVLRLASFWAVAVILFCASSYGGIGLGYRMRVPRYPPFEQLIGATEPTPYFYARTRQAVWNLQQRGFPAEELRALFRGSILPALASRDSTAIERVLSTLPQPGDGTRSTPSSWDHRCIINTAGDGS